MYCKYCGRQIDDDAQFCPYCGKQLGAANDGHLKQRNNNKKKGEKAPRKVWRWLVFLALFVIAAIALLFALKKRDENNTQVSVRADDSLYTPDDNAVETDEEGSIIDYERNEELLETSQGPGIFDLNGMELEAGDGNEVKSILVDYAGYFGIEHCAEQLELSSEDDVLGEKYYRYQQYYGEYPVYGKEVIVNAADDKIVSVIENTARLDQAVTTYKEDALQLICETLGIDMDSLLESCKWYLYDIEGQYTTAIAMTTKYGESIIADANTGKIIKRSSMIDTVKSVELELQGQVEKRKVNAIKEDDNYYLIDTKRNIYVYDLSKNNEYLAYDDKFYKGNLITFKNEKKCKSGSAVDALYNIEMVYDFYKELFKHKSSDGKGNCTIRVFDGFDEYINNDGTKDRFYDNAAAWGRPDHGTTEILISPRKNTTYANDLDVMGHEFTHSVIHYLINDDFFEPEGDALNEGISDIMGLMIEAYYNKKHECDWNIGNLRDYSSGQLMHNYTDYKKNTEMHEGGTIIGSVAYQIWKGNPESKDMESINNPKIMAELWYRTIMMISRDFNYEQCRTITELNALNMYRLRKITKKQYECILWAFDAAEIKYRLKSGVSNLFDRLGIFSNAYPANMDIFALVYDHDGGVTEEYNARVINTAKQIVQKTNGEPLVMNLPFGNYTIEIMEKESETIVYRGLIHIRNFPDSVKEYFLDNELNILSIKTELGAKAFSFPEDDSEEDTWKIIIENKTNELYKQVIEKLEKEYGSLEINICKTDNSKAGNDYRKEADGLCYLELLDFNNDGVKELLAVAKHMSDEDYTIYVYTIENDSVKELLTSNSILNNFDDDYRDLYIKTNYDHESFIDGGFSYDGFEYYKIYGMKGNAFGLISASSIIDTYNRVGYDSRKYYYIFDYPPERIDASELLKEPGISREEYETKIDEWICNHQYDYKLISLMYGLTESDVQSGYQREDDKKVLEKAITETKEEVGIIQKSSNSEGVNNDTWKKSYIDYIETDPDVIYATDSCTCGLIYLDNDDVPELIIDFGIEAYGTRIVSCKNDELVSYQFSRTGGIKYYEREGLVYNSIGVVGTMFDEFAFLDSEGFHDQGRGYRYDESQMGSNYTYFNWNGEEVSENEYYKNLDAFDDTRAQSWNSYSDEFKNNNYRPDEMRAYLMNN